MNPTSQPYNGGPDSAHPSTAGDDNPAPSGTHEAPVSQTVPGDDPGEFGIGIPPNPKARYWQGRAAFWRNEAIARGYKVTEDPEPAVADDVAVEPRKRGMEESFQPHPRWKGNEAGTGSCRHPATLAEWDWQNDQPNGLERSRHRLNVAADYADDRAPDQMALVLRIDLIRVLMSLTHQMARAESFSRSLQAARDKLAKSPQREVDDASVAAMAKKLRKLRLTEVGGRKESPAVTVKYCLQQGLGGLYDDQAADYIVRAILRYYDHAFSAAATGEAH